MIHSEKDSPFKELMSKSKLEMPFPDFEDDVIAQIKKQEEHENSLTRNLAISWLSFFGGIVLGIVLTVQLYRLQIEGWAIRSEMITLIYQIVISVFVIFIFDYLLRYSRKIRSNELLNLTSLRRPFSKKHR